MNDIVRFIPGGVWGCVGVCVCVCGGVLPKIMGGGVPHGSQNPDPISPADKGLDCSKL